MPHPVAPSCVSRNGAVPGKFGANGIFCLELGYTIELMGECPPWLECVLRFDCTFALSPVVALDIMLGMGGTWPPPIDTLVLSSIVGRTCLAPVLVSWVGSKGGKSSS